MAKKTMDRLMKDFDEHDWNGYAGAEDFSDGSSPMIGHGKNGIFAMDSGGILFSEVQNLKDGDFIVNDFFFPVNDSKADCLRILQGIPEDVTADRLVKLGFGLM